ncbi:MAG: hypothetical protein AAF799_08285 [Myxococcota bacterium]
MATANRNTFMRSLASRELLVDTRRREVAHAAAMVSATSRIASHVLPWMKIIEQLPVFEESSRPKETSKTIKDIHGKQWMTVRYWLDAADPVVRFNHDGLTVELQPLYGQGPVPTVQGQFLPVIGWKATIEGISGARKRTMIASWRADDNGKYKLTLSYDFENDNDRELVRSAIRGDGITIKTSWNHRASYRKPTSATFTGTNQPSGRPTGTGTGGGRTMVRPRAAATIPTATLATAATRVARHGAGFRFPVGVAGLVGAPSPVRRRARKVSAKKVSAKKVSAKKVSAKKTAKKTTRRRRRPTRRNPPPPRQPQTPPTPYTFTQTNSVPINVADPSHEMWQDGPSPWKPFAPAHSRTMYYRATGRPAEFEFLPSEFRLGFDITKDVPALLPFVYNPQNDGGTLQEDKRRIEMRMMATPHVEPQQREELRAWIQDRESVELAYLVPPVVQGRFVIDVAPQGATILEEDETVELAGLFWADFDFPLESWAPNLEMISQPGGGVVGKIFLDILPDTEGSDVSVPVRLSLSDLHADVVEVRQGQPDSDGVPRHFFLRNRLQRPVQLDAPTIYLAAQATNAALPTGVRKGQPVGPFAPQLGPGEERKVHVQPQSGEHVWNTLVVDLGRVSVTTPDEGWTDTINVNASDGQAVYPVTIRAVNLGDSAQPVPEYDSTWVSLQPLQGTPADPPDGRLERGTKEWSTRMWLGLSELWDLEQDPAKAKVHAVELRSDYADLEGLPQRIYGAASNVTVRVLSTERPDSKYILRDEDRNILEEGLDRATTLSRIEARRAADQGWTLSVVPVPGQPAEEENDDDDDRNATNDGDTTTDDGNDTTTDDGDPPTETQPAGPSIVINPITLDFNVLQMVFVTLTIGEGDGSVTRTFRFDAGSTAAQEWAPAREPGTPVRSKTVFMFKDGTNHMTPTTQVDGDMVLVMMPDT